MLGLGHGRTALAAAAGLRALALGATAIACGRPEPEVDPTAPSISQTHAFVRSSSKAPAIVWAVGDGGDGSDNARAVVARIARGRVDRVLYLSDVYTYGDRPGAARSAGQDG